MEACLIDSYGSVDRVGRTIYFRCATKIVKIAETERSANSN